MKWCEEVDGIAGEILQSVRVAYDTESEEYGAYVITIKTSERTLTIKGCHDIGPELSKI